MIEGRFRDLMIKHKLCEHINDEMQGHLLNALYVLEVDYSKFDSTIVSQFLDIENKFMTIIS